MTLYTRHGFVITEHEGDEERPPVYRCGGIGWCEEDSADYLAWRRRKMTTPVVEPVSTDLSGDEAIKLLRRLQYSLTYLSGPQNKDYTSGYYDGLAMARAIIQGEPDILKALGAFR